MQKKTVWVLITGGIIVAGILLGAKSLSLFEGAMVAETHAASVADVTDSVGLNLPTMLEMGSEGCIPCEKMKPIMAQLTEEHGDLIQIEFHDVRENQDIARQYGIRLIPTQVFLREDGTEYFRHEGFFPKEDIEQIFRDMGVKL